MSGVEFFGVAGGLYFFDTYPNWLALFLCLFGAGGAVFIVFLGMIEEFIFLRHIQKVRHRECYFLVKFLIDLTS